MTLTKLPLIDAYETTLSQEWDGNVGTIYVNNTPDFTFPSGETTYVVVDPDNSRIQAAEINAYDETAGTLTCNSISVEKGAGVNYSATVHPIGAKVRISTSYQFWKDIKTDLDSKLYNDGSNSSTTFDLDLTGSNFRIRKDGNDMKFTDDNQAEISLSTLASASGVNDKVKISATDTTEGYLNTKLTAGDGLSKTTVDPAGNEVLDLDIDLSDTAIFASTQGNAGKALKLDGSGNIDTSFDASTTRKGLVEMATDAEAITGTDETRYINAKQLKNWAGFTWGYGGGCIGRSDAEVTTSGSDAIMKDIELTNISGTISLSIAVRDISNDGSTGRIRIYKNGVDTGLTNTFGYDPSNFDTFSYSDISVTAGDNIQVWANGATTAVRLKNFRIFATPIPNYGIPTVVL